MAQIERPALPFRLYRYRSLSGRPNAFAQEIDAIKERYLWCSNFLSMNDPMEGYYRPSTLLKQKTEYERIIDRIYAQKTEIGICCFSDTKENELMWTHYANNYSGMCIGYRTQKLVDGLPNDVSMVRLAYGDVPNRITTKEASDIESAARKMLSQKKGSWAYEREWRVLGPLNKLDILIPNCIDRLYLGARINDDHKRDIIKEFKGSKIQIFQMRVVGYQHNWSRISRK